MKLISSPVGIQLRHDSRFYV